MKGKVIVLVFLVILTTSLISILCTSYVYECKERYYREMDDFHGLVEVLHNIEDISELQSGIIYNDRIEEKYFDNIRWLNYSGFVHSKFSSIHFELEEIRYFKKQPLSKSDLDELKKIAVELRDYVNDFNDYASAKEDYETYLFQKPFDPDAKRLQQIFYPYSVKYRYK